MRGEKEWKDAEEVFAKLNQWLSANGEGRDELMMGDEVCFADLVIASVLVCMKVGFGEDSEDWKRITTLHNGTWARYLAQFSQYE